MNTPARLYEINDMVKADCGDCKGCFSCCQGRRRFFYVSPSLFFSENILVNKY